MVLVMIIEVNVPVSYTHLDVYKRQIPYMGYVANYIQNPPGRYIAIAAAAVILLLIFIPDLFDDSKKKGKGKGKGAEKTFGK